jgi:hypothetical protein
MKNPAPTARRDTLDRLIRREMADRVRHRDPQRNEPPDAAPLTAGFDRSHAERLGPGCYRVLAAPMHS